MQAFVEDEEVKEEVVICPVCGSTCIKILDSYKCDNPRCVCGTPES